MNIKKKLQIVDILFKTTDGEELSEEHIDQALESLVQNPIKRAKFKRNMIEKYGDDVFEKRTKRLVDSISAKSPEWRAERASKAGKVKKGQ